MSSWPGDVGAITMFVEDVTRSKAFYESAFGMRPVFEDDSSVAFRVGSTIINLLVADEAHDLIAPAPIGLSNDGARFQLTVFSDDVDEACAELSARGVTLLNGPTNRDWGMRTAAFADPDGHVWEVAQELPSA